MEYIKKTTKYLMILALLACFSLPTVVKALDPLRLTALTITPEDTKVKIKWNTSYPSTGLIKFGNTTNFGSWINHSQSELEHESWLAGLTPNQKYYFVIEIYDQSSRTLTSPVYNFVSKKAVDDDKPVISDVVVYFITGNTASVSFKTNEASNGCINFDKNPANLKGKRCGGSTTVHDITLDKLERDSPYYFTVCAKDGSRNESCGSGFTFKTNFINDIEIPSLELYQTNYQAERETTGKFKVTVGWQANRPVSGQLKWGTASGNYNKAINLPAPRDTQGNLGISGLEESKSYYYIWDLKDLFNNHLVTPEFVFTTNYDPSDPNQDFDADGLTNSQEQLYHTDPIKADSDNDTYADGYEITNDYNPLGPGRLRDFFLFSSTFAYGKPRVVNLQVETKAAQELKKQLQQKLKRLPVSSKNWPTLVNAYLYGEYPVKAIIQAIKYQGKTVHPLIPWAVWRDTQDYQKYINR